MLATPALDTLRVLPPSNKGAGFSGDYRANIFELRFRAGEIIGGRQKACGCNPIDKQKAIGITRGKDENHFFSNLQTCGSVWTCPVCAMKISKQRSLEVAHILKQMQTQFYSLGFLTLTWRHNSREKLKDVLARGMKVYRAMKKHRRYVTLAEKLNLVGDIRAVEIKHGLNGWHPHLHIAIVGNCSPETLQEFADGVKNMWLDMQGANADERGQKYKPIFCEQGIAEYITKWKAADEMTKGHMKSRSKGESVTPFGMLEKIHSCKSTAEQKTIYKNLFREYGTTMKGQKQLTKARHLLAEYKRIALMNKEKEIAEKTDKEIVEQKVEGEIVLNISPELFKEVNAQKMQSHLLNEFEERGIAGLQMLLMEVGIFTSWSEKGNLLELEKDIPSDYGPV